MPNFTHPLQPAPSWLTQCFINLCASLVIIVPLVCQADWFPLNLAAAVVLQVGLEAHFTQHQL